MELRDAIFKGSRTVWRAIAKPSFSRYEGDIDRQRANDMIYDLLSAGEPCMISRYGSGEIGIVSNYLMIHSQEPMWRKYRQFVTGNLGMPWWDKKWFISMRRNAGIFPETFDILERFSERYLADTPEIDLLGSFNYNERFMPLRPDVKRVHLECLYPFFVERPWTRVLRGKKVLVVHPFVDTISSQAARRDRIFDHPDVWPEYELQFVRAVQSNAGGEVPFADWFEALRHMEDEIAGKDFDVCILGCGAYGLPLAATVKRMGKQAVHMGGGSQLLFGIKGGRWDNDRYHWRSFPTLNTSYCSLYNDYWTRASASETPKAAQSVENACYW